MRCRTAGLSPRIFAAKRLRWVQHRAGFDGGHDAQGFAQVFCPEAGAQAVGRVVHQGQQFFFAVVRQKHGDGSEGFLVEQGVVDVVVSMIVPDDA